MKLAIIVPRYGPKIVGGAETFARLLAEQLTTAGEEIEVWTTCTDNLGTGENVYPPGTHTIGGVQVRRFPIDSSTRDVARFHYLTAKFIQHAPTTVEDEEEWLANNVHSPQLYAHIARYGSDFDLLLFTPYLYGIVHYGAGIYPTRTIIWPCLHDEPFAYFAQTRLMLAASRGTLFNSEAELRLAREQLGLPTPRPYIVGGAIDDFTSDPARFRQRYNIKEPFLLYAGRFDATKNVFELITYFTRYKKRHPGPLKLVLMGKGEASFPRHPDIVPIGFQSEKDKLDVYAAATILVQPSLLESFSIVIMESWLAGRPVLVHGNCEVTRTHVQRSNGGLYYVGYDEFEATLNWLLTHEKERRRMGELGRKYVRTFYNREAVLNRFRDAVTVWMA